MAMPLERSEQLIKEINAMIHAPRDKDLIREVEDQLPLIERINYGKAKQIEGMIAGLRGDTEGVRSKFRAALRSSGNDLLILVNFSQALSNLHCMADAVEHIDQAINYAPDNIDLLVKAVEIHLNAYDTEGVETLVDDIRRLGASDRISAIELDICGDIKEKLCHFGASWQQVSERIECAAEAIYSLGLASSGFSRTATESGVLMEFNVFGTLEEIVSAEREIQFRIANLPYSPADQFIAFACAPV